MDPGKFAQFAIVWEVSACVRLYVFVTFCLFNAYACVYVYAFIYVYIIKLYIYIIYIHGHPLSIDCSIIIPNHKILKRQVKNARFLGGTIHMCIYIYI